MPNSIYTDLLRARQDGRPQLAVVIDPDAIRLGNLEVLVEHPALGGVSYFLVGGSLLMRDMLEETLNFLKRHTDIPCILFPGNTFMVHDKADAILLLSLISGRNSELLIGRHVEAAPYLHRSSLEILSTGYILVDGGVETSVSYISNTRPIPGQKTEIIRSTALAGAQLGLGTIFLDAGSGAQLPISTEVIRAVRGDLDIPIIVGGGIRTPELAYERAIAGADVLAIGTALEDDPERLTDIVAAVHSAYSTKVSHE